MTRPPTERTTPPPRRGLRWWLGRFLHDPRVEIGVLLLIVLSVALLVGEVTAPMAMRPALEFAGHVLTAVFVVELSLRYWVARKKSRFFRRYWLDILAVMPVIRPLRVLRVLRVLRLFRAGVLMSRRGGRYTQLFRGRSGELTTLASITAAMVLMGAMVLQSVESGGDLGNFEAAVWFSMLSLIAGEPVGTTPTTVAGRLTTLSLMVGGLTIFGMFVATASASMVSRFSSRMEVHELDLDELENHIVVLGWNRSGPTVLAELFGPGSAPDLAVVVVSESEERVEGIPMDRVRPEYLYYLSGDYTRVEVLEEAGIGVAKAAVLLADETRERSVQDIDARTVLAALTIERLNPSIFTCAELTNRQNESMLKSAGVEEIVVGEWYAGVVLGSSVRTRGIVGVMDEILTADHGNGFHTVRVPAAFEGRTIAELHLLLVQEHEAILVSHKTGDETTVNPPPGRVVRDGDELVVLARGRVRL
ncbi:MAG: NAD-binding protein [Proteobacteria bacterium]|nr:NAD-binding protein [Pseudomonadota bacterium]